MSNHKRNFVVLGLGTFGRTIATDLAGYGNHVLAIDSHEENVNAVIDQVAEAVIADSRDEEALRQAGVGDYDVAVVAIGHDLEASVLCTMNVRLLGVKTIWAKALSRTHHRILNKLGADRVIHPEQEVGQHVAQMLHNPLVRDYLSLGNGYYIVDLRVPEKLHGESVDKLALNKHPDLRCMGIMRGTQHLDPDAGGTPLEADDKLLLLGKRDQLRDFSDAL
ncbi:MAG: TrkA family potassium uptake protein [Wenzhouxiangellaceae bacterium]|nr:TrkA family potassium uptake protein [Wenzhouxiangellaceae bacterium]